MWAKLHRLVLDELGARGESDWSRCVIDSVNMLALKEGGPDRSESCRQGQVRLEDPPDDGTAGSAPIGRDLRANLHDSQALIPLVKGIPPIRSRRGRRRRKPAKLHADKGYDYAHLRRWLRERGITHRIARKGVESSQRLGPHRWTAERTMAWLAGCRRLHRRYEREADHFLAFTSIACTLICCRRLRGARSSAPHGRGTPSPPRRPAAHLSSCVRFTGRSSSVAGARENRYSRTGDAGATYEGVREVAHHRPGRRVLPAGP